jgi:asparagine synthase (glutamine-hydrolysing)
MASFLGTRHTTVRVNYRDIAEHFPAAVWHAEMPVFRTALVPMLLLSREVRKAGIKVILTGEGADEAFLGYDIFKEAQLRSTWSALTPEERFARLGALYPYLPDFNGANKSALYALFDRFSHGVEGELFSHELRLHNSTMSLRLLSGDFKAPPRFPGLNETTPHEYSSMSTIRRAQYLEFKTLLSGYLLSSQGDRMSLANSVENRCPFLDPRVVKIALDTNLRFDDGRVEKYMLKRAFAGKLPRRIIEKCKQPYRAPDAKAFCVSKPAYLESIQSEHQLSKLGVVDVKRCSAFVARMLSKANGEFGQAENQAFVFLASLSLLHDQFLEGRTRRPPDIDHLFVKSVDGRYL